MNTDNNGIISALRVIAPPPTPEDIRIARNAQLRAAANQKAQTK